MNKFSTNSIRPPQLDVIKYLSGIGSITENFELIGEKHLRSNSPTNFQQCKEDQCENKCRGKRMRVK